MTTRTDSSTVVPKRAPHRASVSSRPWYRSPKGRLVLTTGGLLVLSTIFALLFPVLAPWGFSAATLVGVWPLATKAGRSALKGSPFTINTLISLAAVGAVAIGEAAEGAIVVFLFAIGELLESVAAGRARSSIRALAALTPRTALLHSGSRTEEVPVEELRPGQLVRVLPGSRVPADGSITDGGASVDESAVTGESIPIGKGAGDRVFAGSISLDGALTVRVDKHAEESTIARVIQLVEEAESNKAPVKRFIDRFSRVYTPLAMLVAALIALLPPLLLGASWDGWIYRGLAILLIACPCALVLSVPAAITSAISAGARNGLLIKGGAPLEAVGSVATVAFDKTGTLTRNEPQVTDVVPLSLSESEVIARAAAVELASSHPLAAAIVERANGTELAVARDGRAIAGQGVSGSIGGTVFTVASPRYAAEVARLSAAVERAVEELEGEGKTVVVLLEGETAAGLLAIRDEPRSDAGAVVARLREQGTASLMLTGDNARTASAIGRGLGIEVHAELLPQGKLRLIDELSKNGGVAMVGDGINDAPALARADVGIALGKGTDVALDTADVALLREGVAGVADLLLLSRTTMRNIRQNITFALGLKGVFLVTTLLGITGLWPAILADTGATVIVTANALRLLRFEPARWAGGSREKERRQEASAAQASSVS